MWVNYSYETERNDIGLWGGGMLNPNGKSIEKTARGKLLISRKECKEENYNKVEKD